MSEDRLVVQHKPPAPRASRRTLFSALFSAHLAGAILLVAYPAGAQGSSDADKFRALSLELVNKARVEQKLPPLVVGKEVDTAARAHAADMLKRNYYDHNTPEGKTIQDRFMKAGGSRWRLTAENIARCTGCDLDLKTVEEFHRGWMNSPGHRANILRKGITQFGFGMVAEKGRPLYAVQNFTGPGATASTGPSEPGKRLSEAEMVAKALELLNRERKQGGKPALTESPALTKAVRSMIPAKKLDDFSLAQSGKVMDALPPAEREQWQSLKILASACGGCGGEATDADMRFFVREWLGNAKNKAMLLDPSLTYLGFAIVANGEGKKVALGVVGKKHPK